MIVPESDLKIIKEGEALKVYDPLRRKYVAMTPEEYVRQQFVAHLTRNLGYPECWMANEVAIDLNGTRRRCDTVVYRPDSSGEPFMIVEYKAQSVKISQDVFDQIARYNMALRADYLVVTNGVSMYVCRMDYENDTYHFLPQIPQYH